jgi:hypothetical protein
VNFIVGDALPILNPFSALVKNTQHLNLAPDNPVRRDERVPGKNQLSYIRRLRRSPYAAERSQLLDSVDEVSHYLIGGHWA